MVTIEKLTNLINQKIQLFTSLEATLMEEHEILKNHRYEQLEQLVPVKSALLDELKQLELELGQSLSNPDLNGPVSLSAFIRQPNLNSTPELLNLEKKLSRLAGQCNDQNKINGIMIHSRRRVNQKFLQILQQQTDPGASSTYSRNGETSTTAAIAATSIEV